MEKVQQRALNSAGSHTVNSEIVLTDKQSRLRKFQGSNGIFLAMDWHRNHTQNLHGRKRLILYAVPCPSITIAYHSSCGNTIPNMKGI